MSVFGRKADVTIEASRPQMTRRRHSTTRSVSFLRGCCILITASQPSVNTTGLITATTGNTNLLHGSADLAIQTVRAGINLKLN
jgi:hypothetical protein